MLHSPSTQPLPEEQSLMIDVNGQIEKYGYLIANHCWYEVPIGETKIGRDGSMCSIVLNDETVSKEHAVVESEGAEDTFIYDAGSTNKTKIGKMMLRPHCRYKINDNDEIKLGSVNVKFRIMDHKIKKSSSSMSSQLCSLDKDSISPDERNMGSYVGDEVPMPTDKSNTVDTSETFKSPSVILLGKVKPVKTYYYIPASESTHAIDIFSQATQCEVTDTSKGRCFQNGDYHLKCVNSDEIFNLSTQCEYAGGILQPKDKINSERSFFKNSGTAKSKEIVHYDFNDSGTFDFVKEMGTRNHMPTSAHESLSDDIFELATQCQAKLNESVSGNELNFKNIINKPENFAQNLKMKLENRSNENQKKLFLRTDDIEEGENSLISLSDRADEELSQLMKNNSSIIINNNNHSSVIFKNNVMVEGYVDNVGENVAHEIFVLPTQISSDMTYKNDVNDGIKKITVIEGDNNERESGKTWDRGKSHQSEGSEEKRVVNTGVELKNIFSRNVSMNVQDHNEDMILTQVSHHIPQKNCAIFSLSSVTEPSSQAKNGEFGKSTKTFEGIDNSEDLRPIQIFPNCDVTHCTQDDIATHIFTSRVRERNQPGGSGEANEENQISSIIISGCSPKTVPHLVSLSDSGDETESDMEVKLCFESARKKTEGNKSLSVKADLELCSSRKLFGSDHPDRPSSASSDKTLSDLDMAEFQEVNSALLKTNNSEDFIATQIFTSNGDQSKPSSLYAKTVLDIEKSFNTKTRNYSENCISTQSFPVVKQRKSLSEISGETESDIVIDAEAVPGSGTIQLSSEKDNFNIEENSGESESLIKDEKLGHSSPILVTIKQYPLTPRQREETESESSLTLTPSHPAFEAFSEIDELIGNNVKASDKSDSGIGTENLFERDMESGNGMIVPQVRVKFDSDETDCDEELEMMRNQLGRQETFVISKTSSIDEKSSLITVRSEDVAQTTSNPTSRRKVDRLDKNIGKSTRKGICLPKDSVKHDEGNSSPLKRTLLRNSDEGVQKKRVKSIETRKKKPMENVQADEVALTQSLKLRNRVVRQRKTTSDLGSLKKKTATDTKTSGRNKSDSGSAIRIVSPVITTKEKTSAFRKLMGEFQNAEEGKKRTMSPRKRNGDLSKENAQTITKIVFTGFESDWHDKIILKLGGERVNQLDDGHVLVTDRVRRTVKFLSAVALGLPIASPKWLIASAKDMKFLNPWDFLLEDKLSEERWGFNLKATLEKWGKQKLLDGYTVFATGSTRPPLHEILSIAKCCGGLPMTSRPEIWPEKSIILTCIEDKKCWPPYKYRQVKIVHYEFLLSGVLKHFMDFKSYKLR